jgi:hypothetical protein
MRISKIKKLIRKLPAPHDESWLVATRLELLQSIRNTAVVSPLPIPRRKRLFPPTFLLLPTRSIAVLLIAVVVLGGGGATVLAAQGTIPGETLYPMKRAVGRAFLVVPGSAEQKVRLQTRLAERRLREVGKLFDKKETVADGAAISALAEFDLNLKEVARELPKARTKTSTRATERLDKALLRHQELLLRFKERDLRPEARAAVLRALENLPLVASGTPRVIPFPTSEVRKKDVEKRTAETEKEDQASRDTRTVDKDRRQRD